MGIKFHCDVGPNSVMCFNGGTCVEDGNTSYCDCPAGYENDFFWFHIPNCARSSNNTLIMLIFICIAYGPIITYFLLKVRPYLKRDLVILGYWSLGAMLCFVILAVGFYVESGCYVIVSVSGNAIFVCVNFLCSKSIILTMKPIYAMRLKPFHKFESILYTWTAIVTLTFITSGIAMAILSVQPERIDEYNVAAMVSGMAVFVGGAIQFASVLIAAERLHREIRVLERQTSQSDSNPALVGELEESRILSRLRGLQLGTFPLFFTYFSLSIGVPAVYLSLGSFPYYFVLVFLQAGFGTLFFVGMMQFLKNPFRIASGSSKNESKPESMVGASSIFLASNNTALDDLIQ